MTCINCNKEHQSRFCPDCGQQLEVPRITFASMFNDGFSRLTNMDKGFLYNLKSLLVSPGYLVRNYINGKRKGILNPISFLLISISIYLIGNALMKVEGSGSITINSGAYTVGFEAGRFIKTHLKYFWILSIVWLSIATKLVFGKYNYAEHLAMNAFVIGQSTILGLIGYAVFRNPLIFNPIVYISIIGITYGIFQAPGRRLEVFLQSIGSTVLFFIQLIVIVVIIGLLRS